MTRSELTFLQRFGNRRVIGPDIHDKKRTWVLCDCGDVDNVDTGGLIDGRSDRCRPCASKLFKDKRIPLYKKRPS